MFGSKTPFGGTSTFQPTSFGATTAFGQNTSAFGANKGLGTGFGAPAFGSGPPNVSIFSGGSATTSGGIFGSSNTSFGQPAASTSGFGFPSTNSTTTGLFGGNAQQNAGTSLFQSPSSSAFGAPKTTFGGFGATSNTTGLFGQPQQQQQQQGTTLFGQNIGQNSSNTTGLFGPSGGSFPTAFGPANAGGPNGTTIKFNPVTGSDTMMKNGVTTTINIRHQCITVMKEYESKSLEELRLDDYVANRKGPQQGTMGGFSTGQTTLFNNSTPGSTGLFQSQKSLFGAPNNNTFVSGAPAPTTNTIFGQPSQQLAPNPFGGPKPLTFGPTTTASSSFAFQPSGGTTGLFGTNNNQNKPGFGPAATQAAGTGLFGTGTNVQANTGFTSTGFGSTFNQPNQQTGGLFGPKPGGFGGTSSFGGFSGATNPGNSLFATKPAPGIGTATSTFGSNPFGTGTSTGASLFTQNKPINSFGGGSLGFGTNTNTFGANTGGGLFGSNANKPGGLALSTGFGTNPGTGFGGSTGLGLMNSNLGMQPSNIVLGSDQSVAQLAQQQTQAHQQLLAMGHAPFGDSPLFRSVLQDTGKREEILKPTNPAAQKALTSNNQYKVSPHPTTKLKAKPLHVINNNKASLFDGLDEDDTTETVEMFVPRRKVKKLILKPKSAPQLWEKVDLLCERVEDLVAELRLQDERASRDAKCSMLERHCFDIQKRLDKLELSFAGHKGNVDTLSATVLNDSGIELLNANSNSVSSPVTPASDHNASITPPLSNLAPMSPLSHKMDDLSCRKEQENLANPYGDQASDSIISKFYNNLPPKPVAVHPKRSGGDLDDTIAHLNTKNKAGLAENDDSEKENVSRDVSSDGSFDNDSEQELLEPETPHPAAITLRRPAYYTIPSLDELCSYLDDDGNCVVENLTIGREGFGSVYFFGATNVAGMNLDEIVHFRKKEITVYPDDEKKPPLGEGLNKRAQVTLDGVWPNDKTTCKIIKSPERLKSMQYQEKLERASTRLGAKFVDYRPETGSWVFQVNHFSKYGLEDSDEDDLPTLPAQQNQLQQQQQLQQQHEHTPSRVGQLVSAPHGFASLLTQQQLPTSDPFKPVAASEQPLVTNGLDRHMPQPFHGLDDDDEMEDITQQTFPGNFTDEVFPDESEESFEPPSHRMAMSLGMSSQRMQVMKASLFSQAAERQDGMEDGDENVPRFSTPPVSRPGYEVPVGGTRERPFSTVDSGDAGSPVAVLYPGSYSLNARGILPTIRSQQPLPTLPPLDLSRYILLPGGPIPTTRPRRTTATGRLRTRVALEKSELYQRQHLVADSACFMGQRLRIGWGPKWTVAHCGRALADTPPTPERVERHRFTTLLDYPKTKPRLDTTPYTVTMEGIEAGLIGSKADNVKKANIEHCLQTQLDNSVGTMEDGCPIFVPSPGVTNLHQQAELAQKLLESTSPNHPDAPFLDHWRQVWELCVALWGQIPGIKISDEEENNYCKQKARRRAFSEWLQLCSKKVIQNEIEENNLEDSGYLLSIFSRLSGCQMSEAALLAQQCGDHRLALLLAQAAGSQDVRTMVHQQLENWEEQKADRFINPSRLKIFALLAGVLVWQSSTTPVNTCEGVDWKRTLAFHLWYACSSSASIPDALREYETGFKGQGVNQTYCKPPLPPYLENDPTASVETDDDNPFVIYDVCYHLLKLYVKRSHRMDRLLCPTTWTPNHLDYRLSWILYQGLQAVGFDHLSEYQACSLHTNFAAQLESMDLWPWAIFVLLHIKDPSRRFTSVINVLGRHIDLNDDNENEDFLNNQLLIPVEWIFEAKALKACNMGKFADQAWYLLKAGQWNQSHEIILRHIAPDAIIKENYDYLKSYLLELDPPHRSVSVIDWKNGGRVYLDYIMVSEKVEEIKRTLQREGTTYELERLQPEVTSLCGRVGSIQCHSAKDRLSQSEMAKKTSFLLRAVLSLQNSGGEPIPSRLLTPHLARLPMPEDYALQELRALTQSYLLEMTS